MYKYYIAFVSYILIKVYFESGSINDAGTVTIATGTLGTVDRRWRIKVTYIECTNPRLYVPSYSGGSGTKLPTLVQEVLRSNLSCFLSKLVKSAACVGHS